MTDNAIFCELGAPRLLYNSIRVGQEKRVKIQISDTQNLRVLHVTRTLM